MQGNKGSSVLTKMYCFRLTGQEGTGEPKVLGLSVTPQYF